ncbi:hypothetical protein ACFPIJ_63210 [Dactylosporangium cerinum]|uniref:Uncharacterized protein n=1 Tax=Dactylosporangium cerinum TaxID=1434730 RepID=A0ABV9WLR6_9ACTN
MSEMPDIRLYRVHRRAAVVDFEGTAAPGLCAGYLHRKAGGRVAYGTGGWLVCEAGRISHR